MNSQDNEYTASLIHDHLEISNPLSTTIIIQK